MRANSSSRFWPPLSLHRELVPELGELKALQDGPDGGPVGLLRAADPAGAGHGAPEGLAGEPAPRQQDVVHDGQVAPLARRLERPDQPEPGDDVGTLADDRLAGEPDAAGVRPAEPGHQVDHGALARAVRPDQADHLAFGNREGAVPNGMDAAEGLGQVLDLEQRGAHPGPPSSAACPSGVRSRAALAEWPRLRPPGPLNAAGVAAVPLAARGECLDPAGCGAPADPSLPVSSPGRSRKMPSGRNRSIRMIIRPMRTWRSRRAEVRPRRGRRQVPGELDEADVDDEHAEDDAARDCRGRRPGSPRRSPGVPAVSRPTG